METFVHAGVEYALPSKNGLVFHSVAGLYRLAVRSESPIYDHGVQIGTEKELVLEFGEGSSAYKWRDEDGNYVDDGRDHFDIRGHYANTKIQGEQKGWTDEERALVEKKALATQAPDGHWLHTKPPAQKPWPKYDQTAAAAVAELASSLGLVEEALEYERENKNRKTVVEALTAANSVEAVPEEITV